jgi:serine/threonine protein kinase
LGRGASQLFTRDTMRWVLSWPLVLRFITTTRQDTHQQVAIKTVKREKLSAKLFDNLQSEIEILKSLSHRHITKLIDIVVSKCLPSWLLVSILPTACGTEYLFDYGVLCWWRSHQLHHETRTSRRPRVCAITWRCSAVLPTPADGWFR